MTPKAKFERTGVLFLVMFFAGGVISFALFQKQVLEHDQYAATSLAQSVSQTDIPAQRGRIFAKDRDKTVVNLAVSEWRYNLVITPQLIKDKQKFADLLSSDYPKMTSEEILAKASSDKVFVILTKGLSIEEADKIAQQNYRGVSLVPQLTRSYSEGDAIAAQVLGFVGADGEGKYGVEGARDDILRGYAGSEQQKKDSFGQLIDVLGGKDSTPGQDLVLTIDYNLQYTVESKLKESIDKYKADSGSIIVMDPKTGVILAMAGQPTFDPNNFSLGPSVTVLGKVITNAEGKVYGKENMVKVLENSDNVAMTWISSLVGAKTQREYYTKFGFGAKSGVDLVGESAGSLQDEKEWNDLLRSTAAFGQGVSVSLLQLATAYAVIGNGGNLVTPHLTEKTLSGDKATVLEYKNRGQVIKVETANQVQAMLESVVLLGH